MNVIDLRMDNGLAEKKEDGTTIHVEMEDVEKAYGPTAKYLLQTQGRIQIVLDAKGPIKRSIIVK
jgi:hypothetical protein